MCGRTYVEPKDPALREILKEMNRSLLAERFRGKDGAPLSAEGEILPSSVAAVAATSRAGKRAVFPMRWGFEQKSPTGRTGRLLINARSETAREKPTFREAWEKHRCAVPVSCYYEWEHLTGPDEKKRTGQKYALRPEGKGIVWLAGLYRMEEGLPAFVILTRAADPCIAWMHDRMPLMLPEDCVDEWIRPQADPDALVKKCLTRVRWEQAG